VYPAPEFEHAAGYSTQLAYETKSTSQTNSPVKLIARASTEQLVIEKLDSIFESLLAEQQDLEPADHKAIAGRLWELYR
jgi:hypothetical protein